MKILDFNSDVKTETKTEYKYYTYLRIKEILSLGPEKVSSMSYNTDILHASRLKVVAQTNKPSVARFSIYTL